MACNCKRSNVPGQIRRTTLPQSPAKFAQMPLQEIENAAAAPDGGIALDSERRRIEKLRRDAVRRSLGIG